MRLGCALVLLLVAQVAVSADAAVLCVHKSRKTGAAAEGAALKLRTACKRTEVAVDVVGTVGTERLAEGAVTAAKLAPAAVTDAAIGDGTISAAKLKAGEVVTGRGALLTSRLTVADGALANLFAFPGIGTLRVMCLSGAGRTSFTNGAGTPLVVHMSGVDLGSGAFVSRLTAGSGTITTYPNGGAGGVESIEWEVSFPDGRSQGVTAWVTMGAAATSCVVSAHALMTS